MKKNTDKYLRILHSIQLLIGLIFALLVFYVGYSDSIGRDIDSQGQAIISTFLIIYSLLQIYILFKRKINIFHVLSYPIIYIIFGLYGSWVNMGYVKNWAPHTQAEAIEQNIESLVIVIFIIMIALLTTFYNLLSKQKR